jgi:hypothetical protein
LDIIIIIITVFKVVQETEGLCENHS